MPAFQLVIPHAIGEQRARAVVRDICQLAVFQGDHAEFDRANAQYQGRFGRFTASVTDHNVSIAGDINAPVRVAAGEHMVANIKALFSPLSGNYKKYSTKIFCIGAHRTGTTSLYKALCELGIFSIHYAPWLLPAIQQNRFDWELAGDYDAFADTPFSFAYKKLDLHYPDSKFILTVRDIASWLASIKWLVTQEYRWSSTSLKAQAMRNWIYGIPHYDEDVYRERYIRHNSEVRLHFARRPESFVEMDLRAGDGWPTLCRFLNMPIPPGSFPNTNHRREHIAHSGSL